MIQVVDDCTGGAVTEYCAFPRLSRSSNCLGTDEYPIAKERTIFGGQKSGDYQCLRCGFTWDPHNPPLGLEEKK